MKLRIRLDGKTYDLDVEVVEDEERPVPSRSVASHKAAKPVTLPPGSVPEPGSVDVGEEGRLCRSPVTGVVKAIHIAVGQQVQAHQPIMVLEAMKMETEVTAPVGGTVKWIKVAKGDSVQAREIVAEFG